MNWHKITLTDEQVMHGEAVELRRQTQVIYSAAKTPERFCVFTMPRFEGERIFTELYFSPFAYYYCSKLVSSYDGMICDKPVISEEATFNAGDDVFFRSLQMSDYT